MATSCRTDDDCEAGKSCSTSTNTCQSSRSVLKAVIIVLVILILLFLLCKDKYGNDFFLMDAIGQCCMSLGELL